MAQNETARATVFLDGKQAEAALEALDNKAKDLRKDLNAALQAGDNIKYDKLKKELSSIEGAQRSLKRETYDVERVLKNINTVSWRDLQKAQLTITSQLRGMTRGTEEYIKKSEELKKVKTALADINNETKATSKSWSLNGIADSFNRYLGIAMAVIASLTGIALGFKQVVQSFNDFQERVSNLSALTGLKGGALDWLTKKAKELSTATLEGGIKITKGAQDIVDGFTKMGSARPELLKNKEALAQVTEKALILAEASKIEMVPAIDAVAASMNQFNLDASQSDRIINAIAAGSLEGSAEVADLTESLKNVGTVASSSNMSLEQTVAVLEILGAKQLKGAEGGTKLRGALLKLKDAGVGYASGQFVLRDALIEVNDQLDKKAKAEDKDALKQKVFGIENVTAGDALLQNVDAYDKLTKAVTGTNVAYDQAAINTDNNNARLAQAKNRINIISIELGEKLAPAMATVTGWYGKMLSVTLVLIDFFTKYGTTILAVTATIATYTAVVKIASYWDSIHYGFLVAKTAITKAYQYSVGVLTGRISLATVAQNAWNLAQKLNPIGIILSLLVAASAALYLYTRKLSEAEIAQKALNDINLKVKQSINDEKVEMEQLLRVAQNEVLSKETRRAAIEKLNKLSPEYLGGLTLETINTKAATIATDQYIASLLKKAELEAATEKLKDIAKERLTLQTGKGEEAGFFQTMGKAFTSGKNTPGYKTLQAQATKENQDNRLAELKIEEGKIQQIIDQNSSSIINPTTPDPAKPKPSGKGTGSVSETDEEKAAREKAEKKALEAVEAENAKKIDLINKNHITTKNSETQYNAELLAQEFKFLQEKRDIYQKGSKEYEEINSQISDKLVKTSDQVNSLLLQAEKELKDAKIDNLKDGIEKEKALEQKRWDEELAGLKKRLADITGTSTEELALKKAINDLIEENEKAHNKKIKNLNSVDDNKKSEKKHVKTEDVLTNADEYATSTPWLDSDKIKSFFDARKDVLKTAYEEELVLAGDNQEKQKAAEEKYQNELTRLKQQEIDVTYDAASRRIDIGQSFLSSLASMVDEESALGKAIFLFQQGLAIASIWVDVAKANGKAIASLGPLAAPVIASNTIMGGVQTALIVAQTVANYAKPGSKKTKGKQSGGYADTDSSDATPVGVYHANEFIASGPAVRNPTIKPILDIIDIAQRSGTIRSLNLPAMLGQSGKQSGGYASAKSSPSSSPIFGSDPEMKAINTMLAEELKHLRENGIVATVNSYGTNGLDDAISKINNFKSKVNKK